MCINGKAGLCYRVVFLDHNYSEGVLARSGSSDGLCGKSISINRNTETMLCCYMENRDTIDPLKDVN